jgi:predicted nucleic acid-binding protein
MIAVDTDVLVRLLNGDNPRQAATVLLSFYGFEESAVMAAFARLLGVKNVRAEDEPEDEPSVAPRWY